MVNVAVGAVVGAAWLVRVPAELSAWTRAYVGVALLSSVAVLALVPGLLFLVIHRRTKERWRLAGVVQALVGTLFLALLYTDTIVHKLLGYHFNGAVLNVALSPGSGDAVNLGWTVWGPVIVTLLLGTSLQYFVWRSALGWMQRREALDQRVPLLLQPRVVCLAFLVPAFGIEKSVYAAADFQGDSELLIASKRLPLYPRIRLGRILDPVGTKVPALELMPRTSDRLGYPHEKPVLPADGARPNLFLMVLDSWRLDTFNDELTPALAEFAAGSRQFTNHISSGNDTRFSLFSMLYGLHGSYWFKVEEKGKTPEACPPALIQALTDEGYDIRVFSAASLKFPAFRSTTWVSLPEENIVDSFQHPDGRPRSTISWEKDQFVAEAVQDWLDEREARGDGRPFFCFVLLDGPHQPYFNPGGPYQPSVPRLNYVELGRAIEEPEIDPLAEKLWNTYRNCVLQADLTAGTMLDALSTRGVLDETVVMVTGDHGEEFGENGYWGHTSNFSDQQVQVPFYLKGPGIEPGIEDRPTSHLDVSNSLLELLGADPSRRAGYSLGESLFDPLPVRNRVIAGWKHLGVACGAGEMIDIDLGPVPHELEVYDHRWQPLEGVPERCADHEATLRRVADECARFLAR